ncbi:MAG TPA: dipeptidase [Gemmataceae bacterium]|jgi:membrane dipeptidase|nr:dipeptidase [Gemmataceae bacterium]
MRILILLCILTAPLLADTPKRQPVVLTDEARALHKDCLLVDGHNDLPWQYREKKDLSFLTLDISRPQKGIHTDIPRLREGGVGAQFWAAFVPVSTTKEHIAIKQTLEQIDVIHRFVKAYPNDFEFARTADDIIRIRKAGKIASLIGVEGGHSIDDSLGVLRTYYDLGVRYLTLTHSENTDWADSSTDKPKNNGLSPFGEEVVHEMNRIGMMVDISHVSADTMRHVLKVTKAPVIFSHSSAFAKAEHPRNVPDDVLKQMPANGGLVMVNFYSGFIVPEAARIREKMAETARELKAKYPDEKEFQAAMAAYRKDNPIPRGNIHLVVDHIEHIIKTAGIDHVGIGSDFDGIDSTPEQLEDVSKYPLITQELLNRGYKAEQIRKVLGENFMRVFRSVEKAAARK